MKELRDLKEILESIYELKRVINEEEILLIIKLIDYAQKRYKLIEEFYLEG